MARFQTIIPRLGNKTASWKYIKDILSEKAGDTKYYCEPFLGSGFVFYRLKQLYPDLYCMVGDIDNELGNFWFQSLTHSEEMAAYLETIPSSEGLYQMLGLMKEEEMDDIVRAVRFHYLAKMSGPGTPKLVKGKLEKYPHPLKKNRSDILMTGHMGGLVKHTVSRSPGDNATGLPHPHMDTFTDVMNLLKHRASFLQEDYETLITRADKLWGKDNYLLYLDPPYIGTEDVYDSTTFDHERLYETIKDRDFVLSYNDCEWVREKYKDFTILAFEIRKRKEVLIYTPNDDVFLEI